LFGLKTNHLATLHRIICENATAKNCKMDRENFKQSLVECVRVTRLGEFSPTERLFTLGSFLKIKEVAKIIGLLSSKIKVMHQF
jgi:hypothetical protein